MLFITSTVQVNHIVFYTAGCVKHWSLPLHRHNRIKAETKIFRLARHVMFRIRTTRAKTCRHFEHAGSRENVLRTVSVHLGTCLEWMED